MSKGDDLGYYQLTSEDHMILAVCSDYLYHKYRTHIGGGEVDITVWNIQWQIIVNLPTMWYDVPLGFMVHLSVKWLTAELKGVQSRY